jgi:hypothetical protein
MAPRVHHHADCAACGAPLLYLAGDPSVGYEDIEPSDGGTRTLVEHTDQRCAFHRFLTPGPEHHVLPGNADWLTQTPTSGGAPAQSRLRNQRWTRTDHH